jgi:hypothetical protein
MCLPRCFSELVIWDRTLVWGINSQAMPLWLILRTLKIQHGNLSLH